MAGVWVVAFLSGHYRFGLIAAGEQTAEMWASALGAVATLILVPIGYYKAGPAGAAAGLFAAELCIWASAWWRGRRLLNLTGHWRLLVRPLIAVLVVMGLLWMLHLDSIGARCGVAFLVLTLLAVVLDGNVRDRLRQMFAGGQRLYRHAEAQDLPEVTR
jgi:O-antigen/teichoic acid export membrane protein